MIIRDSEIAFENAIKNELWQIPCLMSKLQNHLLILFFVRENIIKSNEFYINF